MENKKILKIFTKGLIISLCCILSIGVLSYISPIQVNASYIENPPPTNIDWNDSYFVFYNETYDDVGDGGTLTFASKDASYRYAFFDETIIVPFAYTPITYENGVDITDGTGYFILEVTANIGDRIALTKSQYSDALYRTYEITSNPDMTIDLTDFEEPFLYLSHIGSSSNNAVVFLRIKIYVNISDFSYDDNPAYQLGYADGFSDGSNTGFDDGYNAGYLDGLEQVDGNSFIETLFRPITALHSAVIFDINGNERGGEITIGAIFISILAICGLTAFLKHFAGG